MSDPVTNVEIEDVLSSIRRLVSDGDKARTRDPAPAEVDVEATREVAENAPEDAESKPDRFVLTPAFMVVDNSANENTDADAPVEDANDDDAGWVEEIAADDAHVEDEPVEDEPVEDDAPLDVLRLEEAVMDAVSEKIVPDAVVDDILSDARDSNEHGSDEHGGDEHGGGDEDAGDMVWSSVEDARHVGLAAVPVTPDAVDSEPETSPSRSSLVATIAELEAAVSNDADDYEPDGSEMMGETIAWPGATARNLDEVDDAEEEIPETEVEAEAVETEEDSVEAGEDQGEEAVPFEHRTSDPVSDTADAPSEDVDDYGDDDLDGLLEAGGVALDEAALRAMVSDVVREELTGPLGERITRNVRKLVRREIYRILSSQEFD